ncbi:hypothetical protein B0H10DRAFT_2055362 [Mycena sp. CBHHK59/15]|nr:hypothetical protein B0H10DRAFT_2055362 [Mycena sp. CBHHK59/15]
MLAPRTYQSTFFYASLWCDGSIRKDYPCIYCQKCHVSCKTCFQVALLRDVL